MVKHRLPAAECVNCGKLVNAASLLDDADPTHPNEGDLALCLYCGHLAAYTREFKLRELTTAELSEILADPELSNEVLAMRRAAHAANPQR